MFKKEIYPKTKRIPVMGYTIQLTEKLDGSNMAIFKKNDELYIAQRKNIISLSELKCDDVKRVLYSGLYEWLNTNGEYLKEHLLNNSCICGEWLGMGCLKYDTKDFPHRWYMFAKANVDDEFNLYNLNYNHDLFIYPFDNQEFPNFLGIVPIVTDIRKIPTKEELDDIYLKYCEKVGDRKVEGFVINNNNVVCKYVRMKNGKLVEYSDTDHKGE